MRSKKPMYFDRISEGPLSVLKISLMLVSPVRSMPNMMKAMASGMPTIMKNRTMLKKNMPACISTSCQFLLMSSNPSLTALIYFIAVLYNDLLIDIIRQFFNKP